MGLASSNVSYTVFVSGHYSTHCKRWMLVIFHRNTAPVNGVRYPTLQKCFHEKPKQYIELALFQHKCAKEDESKAELSW